MLRISVLLAGAALIAALSPREAVAIAPDRALVQPGTPLRVMLLPLKLPRDLHPKLIRVREPAATRRRLQQTLDRFAAWMSRASYGRLRVEGQIAPTFRVSRRDSPNGRVHPRAYRKAISRAEAGGIRFGGAIPIFIAPSRVPVDSYGSTEQALIRGPQWNDSRLIAHEVGHVLGLDHATGPAACPRPFRPLACADRPRQDFEYGDDFDVMGSGGDRFGAYPLAVLGLAPVLDAPPGRARLTIQPLDRPQPTLLRLRTARRDWFVDSRIHAALRYGRRARLPSAVAISRVQPRYSPGEFGYPKSHRIPATDPGSVCRESSPASCMSRQLFRPGRSLTVRGAFSLRVLRGGGPVRVETTWLDKTPPTVAVAGASVIQRFGSGAELELDLRTDATGAGVARVEIDQGGAITRVDADDVPGLVAGRRGHGRVGVPLIAGTAASVSLVDAAGNTSPPVAVDLATAASVPAATVGSSPAPGSGPATAVPLADGQSVTISGTTDPAFAGVVARFQPFGWAEEGVFNLPIGADGRFSVTWTPPVAGRNELRVQVPVERLPDGINFRMQTWEGHFRG